MNIPEFYSSLSSHKKIVFEDLMHISSNESCLERIEALEVEYNRLKDIIETKQKRREELVSYKNSVDKIIDELEVSPKPTADLILLLSFLKTKSTQIQEDISNAVPREEMTKKADIAKSLNFLEATREVLLCLQNQLKYTRK